MLRATVIDASPIIRRIFSVILRDYGFEVREAERGHEAISTIMRTDPSLVIVDASLPDKSSLDILRYVRNHMPKTTHAIYCPVEFDILDLQRAQAAGATDVIVKPFDRAVIASKIDAWSNRSEPTMRPNSLVLAARAELVSRA